MDRVVSIIELLLKHSDDYQGFRTLWFYDNDPTLRHLKDAVSIYQDIRKLNIYAVLGHFTSDDSLISTSGVYFKSASFNGEAEKPTYIPFECLDSVEVIPPEDESLSGMDKLIESSLKFSIKGNEGGYYLYSSRHIHKKQLKELFDELIPMCAQGVNESDEQPSYENIKYYLWYKDKKMVDVYSAIEKKEKVSKNQLRWTDAIGLTPFHYSIALFDLYNTDRVRMDSFSQNGNTFDDLYVNTDPLGPYNFCMGLAAKRDLCYGKVYFNEYEKDAANAKELSRLFGLVFRRSRIAKKIEGDMPKPKGLLGGLLKGVGKALFDTVKSETQKNVEKLVEMQSKAEEQKSARLEERIQNQEAKVESLRGNYVKWNEEKEKLDAMRGANSEEKEVFDDNDFDEDDNMNPVSIEDLFAEGLASIKRTPEEADLDPLTQMLVDYSMECGRKRRAIQDSQEKIDNPMWRIILDGYKDPKEILKRISTSYEGRCLIVFRGNTYSVPTSYINSYPELKEYLASKDHFAKALGDKGSE